MNDHRHIYGTPPSALGETKEVKLRLTLAHLIRLHGLKLLAGQNISDTVAKALELYFARLEEQPAAARRPSRRA